MADVKLKPCPFCGGKADHYVRVIRGMSHDAVKCVVYCAECGIEIEQHIQSGTPIERFFEADNRLVEMWNRRCGNDK